MMPRQKRKRSSESSQTNSAENIAGDHRENVQRGNTTRSRQRVESDLEISVEEDREIRRGRDNSRKRFASITKSEGGTANSDEESRDNVEHANPTSSTQRTENNDGISIEDRGSRRRNHRRRASRAATTQRQQRRRRTSSDQGHVLHSTAMPGTASAALPGNEERSPVQQTSAPSPTSAEPPVTVEPGTAALPGDEASVQEVNLLLGVANLATSTAPTQTITERLDPHNITAPVGNPHGSGSVPGGAETGTPGDHNDATGHGNNQDAERPSLILMPSPPYRCRTCWQSFNAIPELSAHQLQSHPEKYRNVANKKCNVCGMLFTAIKSVEHHINVVHLQIRRFACPLCDEQFGCRGDLTRHEQTKHTNERVVCELCNQTFSRNTSLDRHKNNVHRDIFQHNNNNI